MPGQSAAEARARRRSMSSISTVSMSPGFAPLTSIGPVAPLTKGRVTSAGVSCWPSMADGAVIDVDARTRPRTVSPGSTAAMKLSSPTARI